MKMERKNIGYVLREILIVIIGITIAFSMNKCSDSIKNNSVRKEYIMNLIGDISTDRDVLQANLIAIDKKIETCNEMIAILNSDPDGKLQLFNMVFEVLDYEIFNPESITYSTLINSGDMKLINDFGLKKAIQGHYTNYEYVDDIYQKHLALIRDYLGNYMINNADYDEVTKGRLPFLDKTKLKNIIRALTTTLLEKKEAARKGIDSCDSVLTVLRSY
ncbi:DUF6090 family protein [Costertonia aggregata]|uniref:Uncharacterized protein n=1 Tax=Costertonia aggregata TaxID=343403 RepID=A0A7H9AT26_9FLAO|nr:DUF6090 family protein [Costertonia aggregata]QLG46631.1 hypothetical protein HYG79_15155 [Costertonia aggregata]